MTTKPTTKIDLKVHATKFLELWCHEKDLQKGCTYLTPNSEQYHDDIPVIKGAENMVAMWKGSSDSAPGFRFEVKDAIQEGNQVWFFLRITGLPGGKVVDSVDMMVWDLEAEDGVPRLVRTKDVQRVVGGEGGAA